MTRSAPPIDKCYHCGDVCTQHSERYEEKSFCCSGCKSVYQLLADHQLCSYYSLAENDGHQGLNPHLNADRIQKFAALDDPQTARGLYKFYQSHHAVVEWSLPQMHCASCVWLLQHLHHVEVGILSARVNFLERTLTLAFNPNSTSLRKLAVLLTQIGYEPHLPLKNGDGKDQTETRNQWLLLGITGFCFANIMLLSLPEYLGMHPMDYPQLSQSFRYLSLILALPAFYVGGKSFFLNSWKALKKKKLHIDIGIALSITITFSRSVFEIITGIGAGYLDSLTGILFFMHLGRHFQHITHNRIQFNLNYTHFFPLHVKRRTRKGELETISLRQMEKNDMLSFSHQEIIPTDALCLNDEAQIDYSFITGESEPARVLKNEIIYAGGRNLIGQLHVQVIKPIDQNYLLQLWNKKESNTESTESSFGHKLGTYFTTILLVISATTFLYWWPRNPLTAWNALTTILIVACPCALLLSATFTHGTLLRHLASHQIFVKNSAVLDKLRSIRHIVFDKTGTLTTSIEQGIYSGIPLSKEQQQWVATLAEQSNHPYSNAVRRYFHHGIRTGILQVDEFKEETGKGLRAIIDGHSIKMGSASYCEVHEEPSQLSCVHIRIDQHYMGRFAFDQVYRSGLTRLLQSLSFNYVLTLLSGDKPRAHTGLAPLLPFFKFARFEQSPDQKKYTIEQLQVDDHVMMIGDGLNDAGALHQSDVGVAISDRSNHFSPACDILMAGSAFQYLGALLLVARDSRNIILASFFISLLYNSVGLYFAAQGQLSPLIAAILMPLSSITIISFTHGATWWLCKVRFKNDVGQTSN